MSVFLLISSYLATVGGYLPDMTGLLVQEVPAALTPELSVGIVMSLLGYTRWDVANLSAVSEAQPRVTY